MWSWSDIKVAGVNMAGSVMCASALSLFRKGQSLLRGDCTPCFSKSREKKTVVSRFGEVAVNHMYLLQDHIFGWGSHWLPFPFNCIPYQLVCVVD